MPPPPGLQAEAAACLAALRLIHFTASSVSLLGGQTATLTWAVDTSKCPHVELLRLSVDNAAVARSGSRTVRPARTTSYALIATAVGQFLTLGTIHVAVDDSRCSTLRFGADMILGDITAGVAAAVAKYNLLSTTTHHVKLTGNTASVDAAGLHLKLTMGVELDDFPDPTVDVDATIAVNITDDGKAAPYYTGFAVTVHWPWYVHALTGAIAEFIGHFVDDEVSGSLKLTMLDALGSGLDAEFASANLPVVAVATAPDAFILTICPTT